MRNHWITAILKLNWANMTNNRKAFGMLVMGMLFNNLIYFSVWAIFFSKISSLQGWGLREVAFLYSSGAFGYGLMFTLMGGLNKLGHTIQDGGLDIHLARPRSPLLLALLERMRADSLGDMICGVIMLSIFVQPALKDIPLILVLSLTAGLVFASVRLIAHTMSFWSSSGDAAENIFNSFLIAGTNPQKGFNPYLKLALLTVFPAGYIALLPVEILRHFRWEYFTLQVGGSLTITGFSLWLFYQGLKHYASGNKFIVLR